ncbi:hypothetical protein EV715DRAFT_296953 [Schizophyllum commune]
MQSARPRTYWRRPVTSSFIRIPAEQQVQARETELVFCSRRRVDSEATKVASAATSEIPTETFPGPFNFASRGFDTVPILHPRTAGQLGTVYMADPVEEHELMPPLELFEATFDRPYYSSTQGRKKLKQLATEGSRLTRIQHATCCEVTFNVGMYLYIAREVPAGAPS